MKNLPITYRILAISMACLMYFTSAGLTLGKHSCKMQKQGLTEKTGISCDDLGGCKKGCCDTDFQYFQLDQDQQTVSVNFDFTPQLSQFITVFVTVFLTDISAQTDSPNFKAYKPPLILRDIPVLIQSFLL
ncbi:MAG: hypothetical protein ACJAVF_001094 [Paraglaciecola sp.]|jgi:hypothetical protein